AGVETRTARDQEGASSRGAHDEDARAAAAAIGGEQEKRPLGGESGGERDRLIAGQRAAVRSIVVHDVELLVATAARHESDVGPGDAGFAGELLHDVVGEAVDDIPPIA